MAMPTPEERKNLKGSKVETLPESNHDLTDTDLVLKYQLQFTKYFGPDYAYGVVGVGWETSGEHCSMLVHARVKPAYQPTKGKTTSFKVDMKKFRVWRNNINLYDFISVK